MKIITILGICFFITSCVSFRTLKSTTYIKGNDAFILGNNQHGNFSVRLKNTSNTNITIWQCPINGGQHSPMIVKPNIISKVYVERNTALRIENESSNEVSVELLVKGDTGLSMSYKN